MGGLILPDSLTGSLANSLGPGRAWRVWPVVLANSLANSQPIVPPSPLGALGTKPIVLASSLASITNNIANSLANITDGLTSSLANIANSLTNSLSR